MIFEGGKRILISSPGRLFDLQQLWMEKVINQNQFNGTSNLICDVCYQLPFQL
jgi:hypothetical protein